VSTTPRPNAPDSPTQADGPDPGPPRGLLRVLGPGLLVAATGVGAGDLATGALAGGAVGTLVIWAVVVGALFKFVLTEGLARYQIATGETLLEGVLGRLPTALRWAFLLYLLPWTWGVGVALVSASGVATHALLPLHADPATGKIVWGITSSLVGLLLVWFGGYAVFEKVMRVSVGVMFVVTIVCAAALAPDLPTLASGLIPRLPETGPDGESARTWIVALIGGVGGTVTVLSYGYWIREENRSTPAHLSLCRADLAVGYAVTAAFGVAMVVLGSALDAGQGSAGGASLLVALGDGVGERLGPTMRVLFLLGAWSAVFSSLLGVWQAVPYLFADFWILARYGRHRARLAAIEPLERTTPYRLYLLALACLPLLGLGGRFVDAQRAYAVLGAWFVPLLAIALLALTTRRSIVGRTLRSGPLTIGVLALVLAFFTWIAAR
jgi:Mn2+/Fe2+ NRAMP family transporter